MNRSQSIKDAEADAATLVRVACSILGDNGTRWNHQLPGAWGTLTRQAIEASIAVGLPLSCAILRAEDAARAAFKICPSLRESGAA